VPCFWRRACCPAAQRSLHGQSPRRACASPVRSPFTEIESRIASHHGTDRSGFDLLERNDRALQWRLTLIDSARHTIDLQYYVWFGDQVGRLIMYRVLDAADRGVRCILFDDLNTMLHDMTHVELRDSLLARIDRHPNIEIRVFNAWQERSLFGRMFGGRPTSSA
jgi:putative cardiolipin synthase